jgi:hypothetical protein
VLSQSQRSPSLATSSMEPDIGAMDRPAQEVRIGSGCVPNISPLGRRMRYGGAAVAIVIGLVGAARVVAFRQPPTDLLSPSLLFLAAAFGFFQAREKT